MATDTPDGDAGTRLVMRPLNRLETASEEMYAYILLLPAALLLSVIAFFPLARTFWFSLQADNVFSQNPFGEFVGLENYTTLLAGDALLPNQFVDIGLSGSFPFVQLGTPFLQQALFVTLAFAILSVLFETLIGFGQAYVIDQDFRGRRWVRVAIIIPYALPIVIQAMIFYLVFNPTIGWGTELMQTLGVFGDNPLASARDSFFIVLVADIWKTSAFMALLILAGLQSVDRSLYDVARVSGASPWQRFKYITLPIVFPALVVAMLFRTMDAMRIYGLIEATAGCQTVPSMSCLVIGAVQGARRYASGSAIAFLTALVIGVIVIIYLAGLRGNDTGVA